LNYEILLAFVGATAVLSFSPGPDNIYVLMQSVTNGKKYGVSKIIKESEQLFFIIKLFGAAYLLYLAFQVYQSSSEIQISKEVAPKKNTSQLFKQGFTMNVLNPKVTIFFLAFFPGFLFSDSLNTIVQFYILGFLFIVVSAIIFSAIAILSGMISEMITKSSRIGILLKWLQIIVFIGIALYLFLSDK